MKWSKCNEKHKTKKYKAKSKTLKVDKLFKVKNELTKLRIFWKKT